MSLWILRAAHWVHLLHTEVQVPKAEQLSEDLEGADQNSVNQLQAIYTQNIQTAAPNYLPIHSTQDN